MEVTLELWAHPATAPHPPPHLGVEAPDADGVASAAAEGAAGSSASGTDAAAASAVAPGAGAAAGNGKLLEAGAACSEEAPHAVAVARFLMAARSRDLTTAALVPPLQLTGELDRARFDQGVMDNQARQDRCSRAGLGSICILWDPSAAPHRRRCVARK